MPASQRLQKDLMEDTLPPQGSRAWACGVPTAPAVASSGGRLSPEGLLPASLRSRGHREVKAAFKEGVVTEHRPALHLPGKRQRQARAHQTNKPDDTCRSGDGGCFILKPRKKPGVFPVTSDQQSPVAWSGVLNMWSPGAENLTERFCSLTAQLLRSTRGQLACRKSRFCFPSFNGGE
ncbi:uncharacterized protein LOC113890238 [Bos indicus x Bos taurus]|uniref:uncharacterized protein LOC113890238 n=1 Tax=Bos indicus x Bos taurus TaxID=30522 RepID=UPI000F7D5A4F|nr:uncharacterized protein LOC113890238 [Bos indicus x Bos taurus]